MKRRKRQMPHDGSFSNKPVDERQRIPKSEFLPYAPDKKGSVRINHNSGHCSGESKSLKVTRDGEGNVNAVCFRCGATGWYAPEYRHLRPGPNPAASEQPFEDVGTGIVLPPDIRGMVGTFPKPARAWLAKAGLTEETLDKYGVMWSDEKSQLYLPVKQEIMVLGPIAVGWVLRRFQPKSYLTLTKDKDRFWGLLRASEGHSEKEGREGTLVLVEDLLSGLRCREISDTMILLGTSLRPSALSFLLRERYKRAVIFLDADNPQVQINARKIAKKLSWMKVKIVETGKDPKYYTKEQLEELIYED